MKKKTAGLVFGFVVALGLDLAAVGEVLTFEGLREDKEQSWTPRRPRAYYDRVRGATMVSGFLQCEAPCIRVAYRHNLDFCAIHLASSHRQ
jgi:hypothetical protein